jgi:uncharacterized protein YbjQ (UPF0145 family)
VERQWQGSGLPPSAVARINAASASGFRFSQLAVAGQLSIETCGLRPIGTVVGCSAQRIDWGEYGLGEVGCGYVPSSALRSRNIRTTSYFPPSGVSNAHAGFADLGVISPNLLALTVSEAAVAVPYVVYADASHAAWRAAIDRMLSEARGLGADGVVGVELTERAGKGGVREFVASGTAVRSSAGTHLARAFTTTLAGADVAKLIAARWMPASIVLGLSVAILHDKWRARLARARLSQAREVMAITELVSAARAHARQQLRAKSHEIGADGAVLTSQVSLSIEERRVSRGHHDVVVSARATATAIVEVGSDGGDAGDGLAPTGSRSVISLRT